MELLYIFFWLLVALISLVFQRGIGKPTLRLPPGPKPFPVIGNMLFIGGDKAHVSLADLARIYGPVMSVHLGRQLNIVVTSPELCKVVLVKHDQALSARSIPDAGHALGYCDVSVAWRPPCPRWRAIRCMFSTEMFTTKRLDAMQGLRVRKVGELLAYVEECAQEGRCVDVGGAALSTIFNLISTTLFSTDIIGTENLEDIKEIVSIIMECLAAPNISDFFPFLRAADLQSRRRPLGKYLKKLYVIFNDIIDLRLKAMEEGLHTEDDMMGSMLAWSDPEDKENKLDRTTILAVFVDLLVGGSDTSSNTIEWAMAELLRNPRCIDAATKEVREMMGHKKRVEEPDISRLPYLQAVVKETLRLHPPVPLLVPRKAQSMVDLGGYTVPVGARVLVNVWGIGRDERVWPEPEKFSPERFLEGEAVEMKGSNFKLSPFGGGRRICPGMSLGIRMVHLILASFLHGFNWKLPDGILPENMDMNERFGVVLAKATPLLALPSNA